MKDFFLEYGAMAANEIVMYGPNFLLAMLMLAVTCLIVCGSLYLALGGFIHTEETPA